MPLVVIRFILFSFSHFSHRMQVATHRESAGPESTLRDWGRRVPDARKWNQYIASAMKLIETDDRIALHAQQQVPLVAVHPFSIGLIQSSFARDFSITVSTEISTYRYS